MMQCCICAKIVARKWLKNTYLRRLTAIVTFLPFLYHMLKGKEMWVWWFILHYCWELILWLSYVDQIKLHSYTHIMLSKQTSETYLMVYVFYRSKAGESKLIILSAAHWLALCRYVVTSVRFVVATNILSTLFLHLVYWTTDRQF